MLSGLVVHPFDAAEEVLKGYREALKTAPDELSCWAVMRKAPPLPFLPPEWHGKEVLISRYLLLRRYGCGGKGGGRAALHWKADCRCGWTAPLCELGAGLQPAARSRSARNYWKSHDFADLSDAAIEILIDAAGGLPSPECEIFIGHLGGAVGRIAPDATAFPQRSSHYVVNVHGRWREPGQDQECISWARGLFEAAKPRMGCGTAYINFMPGDETERVEAAYGSNYRRLAEIKRRYDPGNFFRMNRESNSQGGLIFGEGRWPT